MSNTKTLPDIQGNETISSTWRRLLERDRNISNLFSGTDFPTVGVSQEYIGQPTWRTDLRRLFIWDGTNWVNLFILIEPYEISYTISHPDVPSSVNNVKGILDLLVERNNLNTVTLPAESVSYIADGLTASYALPRYTSNKSSLFVFIDGVKQAADTYDLTNSGNNITFQVTPARNEKIEIVQHASLTEWDYSPNIAYFTGDGSTTAFTLSFDVLNTATTSVNVAGTELQKNQFTVSGRTVTLSSAPANGASIQISIVGRTSYVTVSDNSIGTAQLKDASVTADKLDSTIPVNVNNIQDKTLLTRMIADSAITSAKINNGAVSNAKIANSTIAEGKLATSVQNKLLGTNKVATAMLQDESVTSSKLAPGVMNNYYTKAEVDSLIEQLRQELSGS